MEDQAFFHGEAISSCKIKELPSLIDLKVMPSPNGKKKIGKATLIKQEDKQVKAWCPFDCSEYTISVNGRCTVCGGITA